MERRKVSWKSFINSKDKIPMPTAPHPVCLPLSLPVTVINLMTAQTLRPNRDVQRHLASHSSTCPTGRGKRCAVGSSTRAVSVRWSSILVSSSPAVTKSAPLCQPPQSLRRFQRIWRRPGDPSRWGPHSFFVSSGRLRYLPYVRWLVYEFSPPHHPCFLYFFMNFCTIFVSFFYIMEKRRIIWALGHIYRSQLGQFNVILFYHYCKIYIFFHFVFGVTSVSVNIILFSIPVHQKTSIWHLVSRVTDEWCVKKKVLYLTL